MPEVLLFVEDSAHEQFIVPLIRRIAAERALEITLKIRSSVGGRPRLLQKLKEFVAAALSDPSIPLEILVIVTDADCNGYAYWRGVVVENCEPLTNARAVTVVIVVPDPYIERWMLLDGRAFRQVFGRGCDAPDLKCERERYKQLLVDAIAAAGVDALFGGMEFAEQIVEHLDLDRMLTADPSLGAAISNLRQALQPA